MIIGRNIVPEGASRNGVIGGVGNIDSDVFVGRNILPEGASCNGVIGGAGNINSDVIVGRNIVPGNDLRNDEDE